MIYFISSIFVVPQPSSSSGSYIAKQSKARISHWVVDLVDIININMEDRESNKIIFLYLCC